MVVLWFSIKVTLPRLHLHLPTFGGEVLQASQHLRQVAPLALQASSALGAPGLTGRGGRFKRDVTMKLDKHTSIYIYMWINVSVDISNMDRR